MLEAPLKDGDDQTPNPEPPGILPDHIQRVHLKCSYGLRAQETMYGHACCKDLVP